MINRATRKLKLIASRLTVPEPQRYGVVQKIVGMTIEATGLNARLDPFVSLKIATDIAPRPKLWGLAKMLY